ncbi:hypothetical protein BDW22DRAFT_713011 [Trametopsis cervina]|nr:hypothetical protein BDW22DRAFT_713011 [Trametopsis cervina]
MTITIRIQYKGEAARQLAAHESNPGPPDAPRYMEQMTRTLSQFSIPLPESSRAIWKSGFITCNWHIKRDSDTFDLIYRGATRAQSVACKAALDSLHISYIHLFENSRPIRFGQKNRQTLAAEGSSDTLVDQPQSAEHNNFVPHKYDQRAIEGDPSASSLSSMSALSSSSSASTIPTSQHQSNTPPSNTPFNNGAKSNPQIDPVHRAPQSTADLKKGSETQDALRKLAESQYLLQLLTKASVNAEALTPKEEMTPSSAATSPTAPRAMLSSMHGGMGRQNGMPSRRHTPADVGTSTFSSQSSPNRTDAGASGDANRPHRPDSQEFRRTRFSGPHEPSGVMTRGRSASPTQLKRSLEAIPRPAPVFDRRRRWSVQQPGNPGNFTGGNGSQPPVNHQNVPSPVDSPWAPTTKRPLSPTSMQESPDVPPSKRHHPVSNVAAEAAAARRNGLFRTPSDSGEAARKSATPDANKPRTPQSVPVDAVQPPAQPSTSRADNSAAPISRHAQAKNLNRNLWDVRRQITALKAREEAIVNELTVLRVPVLGGPAEMVNLLTPEERLKAMELEMQSLRERLEHERERRRLVEEACENERRRRKLAEDILDDTRRESNTPFTLPAMMDAFKKIAQLTGDALGEGEG